MNVAAKVRAEKDAHPERFCPDPCCLWRELHSDGRISFCPRHTPQRAASSSTELRPGA